MIIEEELTIYEFAEKLLQYTNFEDPIELDISNYNIEIATLDSSGNSVYAPINKFIVKPISDHHYTDGAIKVTGSHKFIEGTNEIFASNHPDFKRVDEPINVVDFEIAEYHSYFANGRLNHNTTAGGKAIPFHSSVRIKLKKLGQIKGDINGIDTTVGIKTQAIVVKNRLGPPLRSVTYDIFFNSGIDDFGSWLSVLKDMGFLKQGGAYYTYDIVDEDTGEVITKRFMAKQFKDLVLNTPGLRDQLYQQICTGFIMKYNESTTDFGIDLTVVED